MLPELQTSLVSALRASCLVKPTSVGFALDPSIRTVPMSVPTYWLEVTQRLALKALGVASRNGGVRVAAAGFRLAQNLRAQPIDVRWFAEEAELTDWLQKQAAG